MKNEFLNKDVIINSRKYDGRIHRTWKAKLIKSEDSLLTFVGEFDKEVEHPQLGVIRRGTISYEFYWLDRCYNVFRFHNSDGQLRNFYCNINLPPKFKKGVLDYIDLDVDLLIWKDFSYQILDLDEFEENARRFSYPDVLRQTVRDNLSELIALAENKFFPFDAKF